MVYDFFEKKSIFLRKIESKKVFFTFLTQIFSMFRDCFAYISAIFQAIDSNSGAYESLENVESENR